MSQGSPPRMEIVGLFPAEYHYPLRDMLLTHSECRCFRRKLVSKLHLDINVWLPSTQCPAVAEAQELDCGKAWCTPAPCLDQVTARCPSGTPTIRAAEVSGQ